MANQNLSNAKAAKNDEFYTQYADIQKEINAYLDYDPNVFRGKTVLLPCDDPEWSNFTKFFAQNFELLGLKKLISTSYAPESKNYKIPYQPTLFETVQPYYSPDKTKTHGKIFILERDITGDNRINIDDLEWQYLEGDGDFRSDEIKALRNEADVIVTNPPFSLFREFYAWVMESNKKFILICNKNCITYKEIFPDIKNNRAWSGRTEWSGGMWFETKHDDVDKIIDGVNMKNTPSIWITNIDHGRRHEPLKLMTMEDNFKHSKHKNIRERKEYLHYDNYDAIEVPFTDAIPSDYEGIMGVPISFLDKYCPEQFKIMGMCENEDLYGLKTKVYTTAECKQAYMDKFGKTGTYDLNASGVVLRNGIKDKVYQRILIRKKQ